MAPSRERDDSGEEFESKTPVVSVDDPRVADELRRLWREIRRVGGDVHDFRNQLAIHNTEDKAAFERTEEHMDETRGAIKEIREGQRDAAEKKVSRMIGAVAAAISVIGALIGIYVAIRSDITDLRAKQDSQKEHIESIDRTLDKMDDKLDRALSRGIRPAPTPDPTP